MEIIEVALFGPIIRQPFVEEDNEGDNEDSQEQEGKTFTITEEPA